MLSSTSQRSLGDRVRFAQRKRLCRKRTEDTEKWKRKIKQIENMNKNKEQLKKKKKEITQEEKLKTHVRFFKGKTQTMQKNMNNEKHGWRERGVTPPQN